MKAHPYLNFPGSTEEAFTFYKSVFGGEFAGIIRYSDMDMDSLSEEDQHKIAHMSLPLGDDTILMGTDSLESMGDPLTIGNNFSIMLEVDSAREGQRIFTALAKGGDVKMPYEQTEWAEKYGMCTDKYGVQWMVNYTGKMAETQPATEDAAAK